MTADGALADLAEQQLAQALAAKARGDLRGAEAGIRSIVAEFPAHAKAYYWLGTILHERKAWAAAFAAFSRHRGIVGEDDPFTLTNLGWNRHLSGNPADAERFLRRAIELNPAAPLPRVNLAQVLVALERPAEALEMARSAIPLDDGADPIPYMSLAFAHFANRQWAAGFSAFEARIRFKFPEMAAVPIPRWHGGTVDRLLIQAEQGFGDSIMAARWLPAAADRVGEVIVMIQPELLRLFRSNWPGRRIEFQPMPGPLPLADAFCPMMSLPTALCIEDFGQSRDAKWYLRAGVKVERNERPKIGLCWAGAAAHDMDRWRSMPFEAIAPLAELSRFDFISLQAGARAADVDSAGFGALIADQSTEMTDFEWTALIIKDLDLVITVDTAVGHLAGALGKRVWLLLGAFGTDWRWDRQRDRTHWYPSMRLWHQRAGEGWSGLIARIGAALQEEFKR